jgi:hypothetical protein
MPTDAPHLARQAAPIAQLMSPVLWLANKPDRFDSYSAGALPQDPTSLALTLNQSIFLDLLTVSLSSAEMMNLLSGLQCCLSAVRRQRAPKAFVTFSDTFRVMQRI